MYVVFKKLKMEGFIVMDWVDEYPEATQEIIKLYKVNN
jgi:NADPH-dependent curcumin reductase CurA